MKKMKDERKAKDEPKPRLTFIGFKADVETVAAIQKLTAASARPGVVSPKSVAIRQALIEAAARLADPQK